MSKLNLGDVIVLSILLGLFFYLLTALVDRFREWRRNAKSA